MSPPEGFKTDDKVEATSDEDGFRGAYFEARVVRSLPKLRRYTIEYDAIMNDADESRRLRETVDESHLRPRPPSSADHGNGGGKFALHQPVDAFYNEGWWVGVVSEAPKKRQKKYTVCFPANREELEFGLEKLRPHLEWVDGKWLRPEDLVSKAPYGAGSQVEIARIKGNIPFAWFSAVVLKTIWKNSFLVEYLKTLDGTELVKEIVDLQHMRPCPPDEPPIQFCQGDHIEALYENGWWPGVITEIKDMSVYMVKLAHLDEEIEFCNTKLRRSLHLVNGRWVRKYKDTFEVKFRDGERVEVWTDEEGFSGVWFAAFVIKTIGKDMFLVEYQDLKTDDGDKPLQETVDSLHIRPRPPEVPVDSFKCLEEVDSLHNDGWWVGVISKVLQGGRYMVYFRPPWKEEMEFAHEDLRLHQEWIDGRWVRASKDWL